MGNTRDSSALTERDYDEIEAAVRETSRGRWFLSEHSRRNRAADTQAVLDALNQMEDRVVQSSGAEIPVKVREALSEMSRAISDAKSEVASSGEQHSISIASHELDSIVKATEAAASDILGAAEQIQEKAWLMREQGVDDALCDQLDLYATQIYTACEFQDLTGQRTAKVVETLRFIEGRLNTLIEIWGNPEDDFISDIQSDDSPVAAAPDQPETATFADAPGEFDDLGGEDFRAAEPETADATEQPLVIESEAEKSGPVLNLPNPAQEQSPAPIVPTITETENASEEIRTNNLDKAPLPEPLTVAASSEDTPANEDLATEIEVPASTQLETYPEEDLIIDVARVPDDGMDDDLPEDPSSDFSENPSGSFAAAEAADPVQQEPRPADVEHEKAMLDLTQAIEIEIERSSTPDASIPDTTAEHSTQAEAVLTFAAEPDPAFDEDGELVSSPLSEALINNVEASGTHLESETRSPQSDQIPVESEPEDVIPPESAVLQNNDASELDAPIEISSRNAIDKISSAERSSSFDHEQLQKTEAALDLAFSQVGGEPGLPVLRHAAASDHADTLASFIADPAPKPADIEPDDIDESAGSIVKVTVSAINRWTNGRKIAFFS